MEEGEGHDLLLPPFHPTRDYIEKSPAACDGNHTRAIRCCCPETRAEMAQQRPLWRRCILTYYFNKTSQVGPMPSPRRAFAGRMDDIGGEITPNPHASPLLNAACEIVRSVRHRSHYRYRPLAGQTKPADMPGTSPGFHQRPQFQRSPAQRARPSIWNSGMLLSCLDVSKETRPSRRLSRRIDHSSRSPSRVIRRLAPFSMISL